MRAARLLQMLLILQNRGRQNCSALSRTLEVTRRTVLRDVDALTEAGLPIVVHRGAQGGIELGFDYRTRLTGLDADEAYAMALLMTLLPQEIADLGLARAATRAQAKIAEAFPSQTRLLMAEARAAYRLTAAPVQPDRRRAALAEAVRGRRIVRLQATTGMPITVHPAMLTIRPGGWVLTDALTGQDWPEQNWGDVNISARRFARTAEGQT